MHIVCNHPLDEMLDIFNNLMNFVEKGKGPIQPGAAAYFHYPEIFQKLRDQYLESYIRKVVEENTNNSLEVVDVYLGNWHVSPLSRLWNTNLSSVSSQQAHIEKSKAENTSKRGKSVLLPRKSVLKKSNDFDDIHKVDLYKTKETAEEIIEKHAMLEALFQT